MFASKNFVNKFSDMPALSDFAETSKWLAKRGWSEAAGGNLSVRLDAPNGFEDGPNMPLPIDVPEIAGQALLLSGSGTRAREIAKAPQRDIGLYKIGNDGKSYCWLAGNKTPSSELPAHCAIHNTLQRFRPDDEAIMHTHPVNLIALCHIPGFDNAERISDIILRLQSEARLHLPEGIGFVKHTLPGSVDLGLKSAQEVKRHHLVLWQYHGCLATGKTLAHAFDKMEIFEKCAQIYWTLKQAGENPPGISQADTEKTLEAFGVLERYKSCS